MDSADFDLLRRALEPAYRIERELPRGGMSRIYLARDTSLDRAVVVKVLPPDLVNEASLGRFRREIELTVRLQHPHILPVLSAGGRGDVHFYVTPFVAGESLKERIASRQPMPLADVRRILVQVVEALTFAHSRGVVHRDVKPGNILLLEGNVVLADFGIAKAMTGDDDRSQTETAPGTPAYMAPDLPRGEGADLYAVGVIAYEMLTGQRPAGDVVRGIRRWRASIDDGALPREWLAEVVARLLAPDPADRFKTATELLAVLTASPSSRRRRARLAAVAAGFALLGVVGGGLGFRAYQRTSRHTLAVAWSELAAGRLSLAIANARNAVALDTSDAAARFTLGRLIIYAGGDSTAAEAAGSFRAFLSHHPLARHDSLVAEGYLAILQNNPIRGCELFSLDSAANAHDFDVFFGLGECRRLDRAVVPDAANPGRFVFRASYHAAARSFEAALTSVDWASPEFVYQRLRLVLYTETNRLRTGMSPEGVVFRAYPVIAGDTLAFVPVDPTTAPGGVVGVPEARGRALARNLQRLRQLYAGWVHRAPQSVTAHRMFSETLEDLGNVAEGGGDDVTALDEIRRARALSADSVPMLVCIHVRQLFRSGMFAEARSLADSALRRWPDAVSGRVSYLPGLAALTGQVSRVVAYGRELSGTPRYAPQLDGAQLALPPELRRMRADLAAFAAMGVCDAHVRDLASGFARVVTSDYPEFRNHRRAQIAILERPLSLAASCLGAQPARVLPESRDPLIMLAAAAEQDDRSRALHAIRATDALRALERPSDVTFDYLAGETAILAHTSDSASAGVRLGRALDALPSVSPSALLEVPIIAGAVRAMALYARLADASGDRQSAQRWATAVVALWGGASAELQPTVKDMRRIIGPASDPR